MCTGTTWSNHLPSLEIEHRAPKVEREYEIESKKKREASDPSPIPIDLTLAPNTNSPHPPRFPATMADAPASPGAGGSHESGDQSPRSNVREQDRYLPIANISRIMKKALPANGKIAKDAKETVQECVSEFISFITSEASDKCQREKRKTINGDDLLWAMATLGFEDYIDPLKIYLSRYRELLQMEGDTKGSAKGGEVSTKKDVQPSPNAQLAHQGSFSQGVSYTNSQPQVQRMMVPMQGPE
ncbi:nuclear transcription factor Y subunit B-10-like isoform X2 [Prosopis cineraria]|uniref:nuclear transcription factor Y subunit B-10-like isoform X2 n=1 Tax=Prosopis cineraria TaxID=364024 RepID=UPI00240F7A6E|nr:nuclear transcription factor Y subunit B-10-like isoform X2 [Prosopis cineraria]